MAWLIRSVDRLPQTTRGASSNSSTASAFQCAMWAANDRVGLVTAWQLARKTCWAVGPVPLEGRSWPHSSDVAAWQPRRTVLLFTELKTCM